METIETARLGLRPFTRTDEQAVFAIFHDEAVARTTYYHAAESESRQWLTSQLKINDRRRPDFLSLAIVRHDEDQLIGWAAADPAWRKVVEGELALHYVLARAYWGQGYMTEAVTAVIEHLFTHTPAPQITADCEADNHGSRRVMEKVGMVYEGIEQKWERDLSMRPYHRFSLSRAQWQAKNASRLTR